MKTSTSPTAWGRFLGFWFTSADPSTMAFIRIVTGCLAVYVHLVYSLDLTAFFSRTGWYHLDAANAQRWQEPTRFPTTDWEHTELTYSAMFPDTEGPRRAVFAWVRNLPTDSKELARALRLIDENGILNPGNSPRYPYDPQGFASRAYDYAFNLANTADERNASLRPFTLTPPKRELLPPQLQGLTDDVLPAFARDLDAFAATLPPHDPATTDRDRTIVITYLRFLGPTLRDNLLAFLRDTTADRVPAFERERRIAYLERWGYEERFLDRTGHAVFSIWFHITEPGEMVAVHAAVLVVMVMFTLGLFTRVTAVLTWVAAVGYLHRNPQVLFGQDTMMNILLIYCMIANSGAALSLDRVIARYRAVRASLARSGGIDATCAAFLNAPPPSVSSGFAQRLLQVHFCFIYMAAGLSKLKGGTWWSADATWLTLINPEFTLIHFDWYAQLLRGVFSSRPLYSAAAAGMVLFTLFVEIGLPFLVWTRLRPYMVIGGFLLHFGVGVFMGLLVFSLFMMTMLLSYLPGVAFRDGIFGGGNSDKSEEKKVPVNPADGKSAHRAAWAMAWDMTGKVQLVKG
ncbi:MAG: hypothetical protein MUF18_19195 [Fimbriiglobus sp.]|nr:hypothetical protein [Fimbriiglobus sp.]